MTENGIICRRHGKIVGTLVWDTRPGATYEMHLDVEEEYQRQGVGKEMLQHLETMVRSNRGMCIYSFSAADNEKAIGFFIKMGFTKVTIPGFYGKGRDAIFYHKTVGAPE